MTIVPARIPSLLPRRRLRVLAPLLLAALLAPAAPRAQAGAPGAAAGAFRKVVLDDRVTRAHALDVADDGRVFFIEREGAVKVWDPATRSTRQVGFVPVNAVHTDGLLGIALDPDFLENGWIYLYFSPYTETENVLARFTIEKGRLVPESRRTILVVPGQRQVDGGHTGGALAFGPDGSLFLSTGDNSSPRGNPFAPLDERPGRERWDAQRTSANTHDLRGKILRIHPLPDGTYRIPPGNLFPYGSLGRPEIYVMGTRQPFRIAVDPRTGWLFWGDVGPDANEAEAGRGPAGHDEFNVAREPGNYGWPYFVADNQAYHDYDFAAEKPGEAFRAEMPVNESVNNTGARVLPPAVPAMIWYPYAASERFPELGTGGRSAMVGPLYRHDPARGSGHGLTAEHDGALFLFDFMRNWVKVARFGAGGELRAIEPFAPDLRFVRPIAMDVGPDGSLYLIEWGTSYEGWYNDDARLVRLERVGAGGAAPETAAAAGRVPEREPRGRRRGRGGEVRATAPAAPPPTLAWPLEGGVFDFDRPLPYRVAPDAAGEVWVEALLGHDSHTHPQGGRAGAEGTLRLRPDETHMYLEGHFAVVEASRRAGADAPLDPAAPVARVTLQPRRKQAEHATRNRGAQRETVGSLRVRRNVEIYLRADSGDVLGYAPVNLRNIQAVVLRVAPDAGGSVELRVDGEAGPLLGTARVPRAAAPGEWVELTVPVADPGGARELVLVFRGAAGETVGKLDWLEFRGPGMMLPPG